MGFDLHGVNPINMQPAYEGEEINKQLEYEEASGIYFRNNCWWWRPLWGFVCQHCSEILNEEDMARGGYNDGHKITATKAKKIAIQLEALDLDGTIDRFETNYKNEQEALDQVKCTICEGTGKRKEPPATGAGNVKCNGCQGTGKHDDWMLSYPFNKENVLNFAEFAKNSGGFEIF